MIACRDRESYSMKKLLDNNHYLIKWDDFRSRREALINKYVSIKGRKFKVRRWCRIIGFNKLIRAYDINFRE